MQISNKLIAQWRTPCKWGIPTPNNYQGTHLCNPKCALWIALYQLTLYLSMVLHRQCALPRFILLLTVYTTLVYTTANLCGICWYIGIVRCVDNV